MGAAFLPSTGAQTRITPRSGKSCVAPFWDEKGWGSGERVEMVSVRKRTLRKEAT
jgi:hypothetical protein